MAVISYMIGMQRLSDHRSVAWDVDGTLYDHPNSEMFAEFIRQNPYDQIFHIITFRSHGFQNNTTRDLKSLGLRRSHFKTITNVEDFIYAEYHHGMRMGNNPKAVDRYMTWKGMIAEKVGATVLLDDMTAMVEMGCERHGIALIHPDDLEDWR
jgi:hypothetical protein